jgi:hypothetical protein
MEHKRNSFETQNVKNSAKRDRPFAKRNKQSLAKRGKTSKGFATAIQSTADNIHNLQEALKAKHELRHKELKELSKLLETIRNVKSEIELLEPISYHDIQQLEKRTLKRDLVMLLLAIAIPTTIELLRFSL